MFGRIAAVGRCGYTVVLSRERGMRHVGPRLGCRPRARFWPP